MNIFRVLNGAKKKLKLNACDVQLLDLNNRFTKKNVEDALNEVGTGSAQSVANLEEWVAQLSNPNLLINGDFREPVNQRGQTSYKGQYTVDRWQLKHSGTEDITLTVNDGYITLQGLSTQNCFLIQPFEDYFLDKIDGKYLTISARYRNTSSETFRIHIGNNANENNIYLPPSSDWTEVNGSEEFIKKDSSNKGILIQNYNGTDFVDGTIDIEWVKLELGDKATPFVPRPYGEELALCQRYYLSNKDFRDWMIGTVVNGKYLRIPVPTPETMRVNPTIIFDNPSTENKALQAYTGSGWIDLSSVSCYISGGCIWISTKCPTEITGDVSILIKGIPSFDAEIY